jgi:sulfocyanin
MFKGLSAVAPLIALPLIALLSVAAARADEKLTPSWMRINAADKKLEMTIIAGWNPTNGVLNYNGYHDGNMTVVVPVGWLVEIDFTNKDGDLPHSILVTQAYPRDKFPGTAGHDQVAISRAYSRSPETGIEANEKDSLRFTARDPGKYYFYCGAQGHGDGGMWTWLEVSAEAGEPHAIVAAGAKGWR